MGWQYYLGSEFISYATSTFWEDKAPVLYFDIHHMIYEPYTIEAVLVLNGPIYEENLGEVICIGLGDKDIAQRVFVGKLASMRYEGSTQRTSTSDEAVDSINLLSDEDTQYLYRVWLEHPLANLERSIKYHIEENETKRAIIIARLSNAAIETTSTLIDDQLPEATNTQYGENTKDYIIRLMQECGIVAYFDQPEIDYTTDFPNYVLAENLDAAYRLELGFDNVRVGRYEFERLLEFTLTTGSTTQSYQANGYNFLTPMQAVTGQADDATEWTMASKQIYPINDTDSAAATEHMQDLLKNETSRYIKFKAHTTSYKASVGKILVITDTNDAIDGEYVIEKSRYTLMQTPEGWEYSNLLEGVAYSPDYRPPITKIKPKVYGNQTAIVIGNAANSEVNVDAFGRLQVKFIWSVNEAASADYTSVSNPSAWARLMQWGPSGDGWGNMALPRVGQEVVVGFLNADPDQPIILGSVFNGAHKPAYELPKNNDALVMRTRTLGMAGKSGLSYNEFRMVDTPLKELVSLRAQNNAKFTVLNDTTWMVGGDHSTTLTDGSTIYTNNKGNRYEYFGSLMPKIDEIMIGASLLANFVGAKIDMLNMELGLKITHIIAGAYAVVVGHGDVSFYVSKGTYTLDASLVNISVLGLYKTSVTGRNSLSVGGNNNVTIGGDYNLEVGGLYEQAIKGVYKTNVTGEHSTTVQGAHSTNVEGVMSMNSALAMNIEAGAEMSIEAGGALSFKAADINIECAAFSITCAEMNIESAGAFNITCEGIVAITGTLVQFN